MSSLSCMPLTSAGFHLSREERHTKKSNVCCSHIWAQWNKSQMTTVILSLKTAMKLASNRDTLQQDEILSEYSVLALTV